MIQLIYPQRCVGCGSVFASDPAPLCHLCLRHLERVNQHMLMERLSRLPEASGCLDTTFALWHFDADGTVQRVQHQLKYGNQPSLGRALGEIMGSAFQDQTLPQLDVVIPIPLHRRRYYERGYNQSTLLAVGMAKMLEMPVRDDVLIRHRSTRSQTRLSRKKRWTNVAGAFTVRSPETVADLHILLVDDVLTTGATLTAAALTLKESGAKSISAATLALARS